MSTKPARATFVPVLIATLLAAAPVGAQSFNYFPGDAPTDDSRTVALAGDSIETLAQDSMSFLLIVPPGETVFDLGIFDGETGGTDEAGERHWDNGTTELQYALYYDPYRLSTTDPGRLVGIWYGNQSNPAVDPGGDWVASSATFPDNDWWSLQVQVPEPPEPAPGLAPSGATYYHLCVSYRAQTSGVVADPCTGDPRPVDASSATISNFKLRATANISVLSFAFAYEAAMRFSNADPFVIYPEWDGSFPAAGSSFWLDTPTTYDGTWSFEIDVPTSVTQVVLFDGDFDYGTRLNGLTGFPSGVLNAACLDLDDVDTPNTADFPPFAVELGNRLDDSLPEGVRASGSPADDNSPDVFRRSPCIRWTLTSPGPDGDLATTVDNVIYANANPSSQREWEQFRISTDLDCDASVVCNPLVGNCADYCTSGLLPAGKWRIDVEGVDLSNLNAWRSGYGFCTGGRCAPLPYLIGDTVFADTDEDGIQDPGEPGISGVLLELLDAHGTVLRTVRTGDPSFYTPAEWEACKQRNTGGATLGGLPIDEAGLYCFDVEVPDTDPAGVDTIDYTVRVAAGELLAGGTVFTYFSQSPIASRPSPAQTFQVVEEGANVMTYDFGYFGEACGPCTGKVTEFDMRYLGAATALVRVVAKRGPSNDEVFNDFVAPGEIFHLQGPNTGGGGFFGTLGTEITFFVDGAQHTQIHTSCSSPVGPGLVSGDFEVVAGRSSGGGPLCPLNAATSGTDDPSEPSSPGGKKPAKAKAK